MALNATVLAANIKADLVSGLGVTNEAVLANLDTISNAIASRVVAHIVAQGLVTITSAVATGVLAGGAAVPVTGIGTIS